MSTVQNSVVWYVICPAMPCHSITYHIIPYQHKTYLGIIASYMQTLCEKIRLSGVARILLIELNLQLCQIIANLILHLLLKLYYANVCANLLRN